MTALSVFPILNLSPAAGNDAATPPAAANDDDFTRQFESALAAISPKENASDAREVISQIVDHLKSLDTQALAQLERELKAYNIDPSLVQSALRSGDFSGFSSEQLAALQRILAPVAQTLQLEVPALSSLPSPVAEVDVSVPVGVVDIEAAANEVGVNNSPVEAFLKLLVGHVTGEDTTGLSLEQLLARAQEAGGSLAALALSLSDDGVSLNELGQELESIFASYFADTQLNAELQRILNPDGRDAVQSSLVAAIPFPVEQANIIPASAPVTSELTVGAVQGATSGNSALEGVLQRLEQLLGNATNAQAGAENRIVGLTNIADRAATALPLFADALARAQAQSLGIAQAHAAIDVAAAIDAEAVGTVSELSASSAVNTTAESLSVQGRENTLPVVKADGAPGKPVAEQVQLAIQKAIRSGVDRFVIQLEPAELGRVEVRLDIGSDSRATINVTADNRDTLDLLQRDARALERMLAEAGIDADAQDMEFQLGKDNDAEESERNLAGGYDDSLDEEELAYIDALTENYTLTVDEGVDIKV